MAATHAPEPACPSVSLSDVSLVMTWPSGEVTRYPWIWLRDHAHDEATMHPVTQQRQLFTAALPDDLAGTSAVVREGSLVVSWSDGSADSVLPLAFLSQHRRPLPATARIETALTLWDAATISDAVPTVQYDDVMGDDAAVG